MSNLQQQFPEMTQSVFVAVLNACEGDETKAKAYFEESSKKISEGDIARMVQELAEMFPDLDKEVIKKTLGENKNDVDASIVPLFTLVQDIGYKKRQEADRINSEKREAEREAKQKQARVEATQKMTELFKQISPAEINRIIEENDGDLEVVSERLAQLVAQKEEVDKKEREAKAEQERREAIFETLRKQISKISDEEIRAELERCGYDPKIATPALAKISNERKTEEIAKLYPGFDANEIEAALYSNRWELLKAMEYLDQKKIDKKKQQQEFIEKQKEIQRQQKDIQKKMIQQLQDKQQQEMLEKQKEEVQKLQEQQEQQEQQQKKKEEASKEEMRERMEKCNLEQSVMIQKKIGEAVAQVDKDEADAKALLKEDIEKALRENPNLQPGAVEKEKPELNKDDAVSAASAVDAETYDFSDVIDRCKIAVTPTRPDLGQDITVSWTDYDAPSDSDWISMNDASTGAKLTWEWTGAATASGKVVFKAQNLGEIVFCYVNKAKHIMAKSKTIFVGPEYKLETTKVEDMKYSLKCTQLSGIQHPNAWIGLYQKGENNANYYSYQWLSKAVDLALIFDIPKTGNWELRLFPIRNLIGSYVHVGSTSISIDGNDKVELVVPADEPVAHIHYDISSVDIERDSVWIGLYLIQEIDNRQYRRYRTIKGAQTENSKGTITFKKPIHKGKYEARLFAHGSLDPIVRSNAVEVEGI
eukprot:TRINITY_DN6259_c0_g1_i1.p1 TRINITY_DN6259_c0_g1~~TRINITY_DN6259_c0_g1_i1.p1  ORF type:complete len:718 (-),score=401.31 TRINITY_DN6259_c0_g1_i1:93-2207(-)